MKAWPKKAPRCALVLILIAIIAILVLPNPVPEGSVAAGDIVSHCVGDAANDGTPYAGRFRRRQTDERERYGAFLLVCDASGKADMERHGYIPPEKIRQRIDLSGIKPMKVQLGEVNGDGAVDVSVCVCKTAKFHPVMAKRPFFFNLVEGNLIPLWLGSRLSRPFADYILYDVDEDAVDEIISIEHLENGGRVVAAYDWKGFGFEILAESDGFDGRLRFRSETSGQTADAKGLTAVFSNNREQTELIFRLVNGKLIFEKI
jgi:hypothetical protein